jgi:hypothetical protein
MLRAFLSHELVRWDPDPLTAPPHPHRPTDLSGSLSLDSRASASRLEEKWSGEEEVEAGDASNDRAAEPSCVRGLQLSFDWLIGGRDLFLRNIGGGGGGNV